jgi:ubiquinone/menaquinone biosynthesis C-methylase UbiE
MPNIESQLNETRKHALDKNLTANFAKLILPLFICPRCKTDLIFTASQIICANNHIYPIKNGIPDFVNFTGRTHNEKIAQANFHDDEQINETFDEIVNRPYNYNKVHADSWLYHLKYFKKILPQKLGIGLQNTTILNCGCGGGFEAQFFAEHGALVVGFDISQLRAEASATRFELHNLIGMFYRGDAALLPFADNTFDLVLYHDSLHHVPIEEIPLAFREAARVAKKGIVLLEANDSPLRMLLEAFGLSKSIEESGNYVFRFKKSLIQFWAMQTGLQLVNYSILFTKKEHRAKFYAIPMLGWILYCIVRLIGLFLKPLGNEACIILKKPLVIRNKAYYLS